MMVMLTTYCVLESGLSKYLRSSIGGGKSDPFVSQLAKLVLNLLHYTKMALDGTGFTLDDDMEFVGEVWSTAWTIATSETASMADHLDDLHKNQGLKDTTLRGHVATFKLFFYWFSFVFKHKEQYHVDSDNKKMLEVVFVNLTRYYSKKAKEDRKKNRKSIEERVAANTWPENGFEDLEKCLLPHIEALLAMDLATFKITEANYRHVKQVLISAIYALSPQGRSGGVKSMLLKQSGALIENGK
jgi:hypothetical protein